MKHTAGTIVLTACALLAAIAVLSAPALAWTGEVDLQKDDEYSAGEEMTVGVRFENTGWKEIKVTNVSLRFDWMPMGQNNFSSAVPVTVGPNGTYIFYFKIVIPSDVEAGAHDGQALVYAADPREPSGWETAYLRDYAVTISVAGGDDESQLCGSYILAIPATLALPVVGAIALRKR